MCALLLLSGAGQLRAAALTSPVTGYMNEVPSNCNSSQAVI